MSVLLINPPSPYLENDASYPPMGLMYIAAKLNELGYYTKILDLSGSLSTWKSKLHLLSIGYDLVGVTCVTPNIPVVKEIISSLPENTKTMVGGAHPTFLPEDTRNQTGCSCVVRGEAETVMRQIMQDCVSGKLKKEYQGGMAPTDMIPKPARNLVELSRYTPGGDQATPIYTSRGCPFNCRFCSKITGNKYREFSIERVVDEVLDVQSMGFSKVVFGDDNLGINQRRLCRLFDAISKINISFRLNMDARNPNEKLLEKARASGCTDISYGIESGSQEILDAMNKQTTIEKNIQAIRMTQKQDLEAKAYFMVNFPGETEKTVKETLAFAEEARPDKWLLSSFAPLPGSYVYIHPEEFGITDMSKNWGDYYLVGKGGQFKPCYTTDYLTTEKQIELHDMMFNGLKEILG